MTWQPDKHKDPEFIRTGRIARAQANNNPNHQCRDCKLTLTQRRTTHPKARWHWGHPRPPWTDYGIECDHCNCKDAARTTNNRQASTYNW